MISRRLFLQSPALALTAPMINRGRFRLFAGNQQAYCARTIDLVRQSTVVDMLGLLTLDYRRLLSFAAKPELFTSSEAQRLRDSGVTVLHPAVGHVAGDISAASRHDLDSWNAFLRAHDQFFCRMQTPSDLRRIKSTGKIGVILGLQNSSHFESIADVDRYFALGQRVSQLTYHHNRLGGGSTGVRDPGLTPYGSQIVSRMNALGMAVDVSHCGDRTTLDAVTASAAPVLVTHSNCRALVPSSRRCKPDEAIRKLAARGGVFGVTMIRPFVRSQGPTTIEHVLQHIDHVARLTGIEHVGVGTDVDLDGRDGPRRPRRSDLDEMDYANKIYELTQGLVRRGYSDQAISLILGGNFQRALQSIWEQPCCPTASGAE